MPVENKIILLKTRYVLCTLGRFRWLSAGQTVLVSPLPWLVKAEGLPAQQALRLQLSNHNPMFCSILSGCWAQVERE